MDPVLTTVTGVVTSLLCVALISRWTRRDSLPLPPGPRGLPLLNNLLDVPKHHPWVQYAKWGREYGQFPADTVAPSHLSS
jgi:hypothetical protein